MMPRLIAKPCFLVALAIALASAMPALAASRPAVEAQHGMVVSSQHYASRAGLRILQQGGNAIDAAVAVGYALAVVDPCCGNIGGGGFMVIHLADGRETFINFRETAPAAAREAMYLDAKGNAIKDLSLYGYLAAGVPGTVMGLDRALSRIRHAAARQGHGARDRACARRLHSLARRHRHSRFWGAALRQGSCRRQDLLAVGRQAFSTRRPPHSNRPRGDAFAHRRARAGCLLQGPRGRGG